MDVCVMLSIFVVTAYNTKEFGDEPKTLNVSTFHFSPSNGEPFTRMPFPYTFRNLYVNKLIVTRRCCASTHMVMSARTH